MIWSILIQGGIRFQKLLYVLPVNEKLQNGNYWLVFFVLKF